MHIQAAIVRGQPGVGHVLNAVTESPVRGKIPVQPNVACELNIRAEVPRLKVVLAEKCRTNPAFQGNRQPLPPQDQGRSNCTDGRIVALVPQPASREVQPCQRVSP